MATATATPAVGSAANSIDNTQKSVIVNGTVTLSSASDTYAAGGIIMSFVPLGDAVKSNEPPIWVRVWSQPAVGSPNTTLYLYSFNPGATLALGKLQIWEQSGVDDTPLDEYDDATALTNPGLDTIVFEAKFLRL